MTKIILQYLLGAGSLGDQFLCTPFVVNDSDTDHICTQVHAHPKKPNIGKKEGS
jgi:hypothetical protein